MSNLMLENGAHQISRYDLRKIETPEPTSSWKPVAHAEIADLVCAESQHRNYHIISEEFGVNNSQTQMFGVLRFHPEGHPEYSRALACRNSINKSLSVGLACGISVLCCSNLCFGGEAVIHRKHTSGIEIEELIPEAFDNLEHQFIRLEQNVERMKLQILTVSSAKLLTVKAAEMGAINSSDIIPVLKEFKEPRHEEFSDMTRWSLYNSCTELIKNKFSPIRSEKAYRRLGQLFDLR